MYLIYKIDLNLQAPRLNDVPARAGVIHSIELLQRESSNTKSVA